MAQNRRYKAATSETDRPPKLKVPVEQLSTEIDERLAKGQALLDRPVSDIATFEDCQADYYTWSEYNQALLRRSFDSSKPAADYAGMSMGWPHDAPLPKRWEWLHKDISRDMRQLYSVQEQLDLFDLHPEVTSPSADPDPSVIGDDIFIVHGHDGQTKVTVARFLAKLLGHEATILHEQPDCGRTIIEKFEDHAAQAACAVVLLTADDVGGPKNSSQQDRPRQNVVLELGFFLGKIGRGRVVILYEPTVELPSDLSGVLYIEYDHLGTWRNAVARELTAIGIQLNLTALL